MVSLAGVLWLFEWEVNVLPSLPSSHITPGFGMGVPCTMKCPHPNLRGREEEGTSVGRGRGEDSGASMEAT